MIVTTYQRDASIQSPAAPGNER